MSVTKTVKCRYLGNRALLKYLQCTAKNSHQGFSLAEILTKELLKGIENVFLIGGFETETSHRGTVQLLWFIAKLMMSQLRMQKEDGGFHFKTDATNVVKGPHLWLILCTSEYLIWDRTHFQTDSFWAIPYTISKLYQFKINTFHKPRFKLVRNIWIKWHWKSTQKRAM